MKKIVFGIVTAMLFSIGSYAQQPNQVLTDISAPTCCPTTGFYQPGTIKGIWGWCDNGNSAGQIHYLGPNTYTQTFVFAFPTNGSTMTHIRCTTEYRKGYCGLQPGEWMVCRDQKDHEVGLSLPNSQHFYLSLLPYPIPSPAGGGDPND